MILRTLLLILLVLPLSVAAKIKVVASTTDLAYFARQIGGDLADVQAIAGPKADLHFVEARPSYMVKVARADLAFRVGLELDMWFDKIVDGSRNGRLTLVDCSKYIEPLEVPGFKADARYGDLHRFGNPHYWTGPQNLEKIARAILEGYTQVDPANAEQYTANRDKFIAGIEAQLPEIQELAAPLNGMPIVFYHDTWPYFNAYFGTTAAEFIEPYPGVQPSPSHIKHLAEFIKGHGIKIIAIEPYFDARVPNHLARETGAKVVVVYPSIGGRQKDESYIDWLKGNISTLLEVSR